MTFTKAILQWYENNSRDLPWRETNDPYLIWISEIILQQTRIGQGLGYYSRFIERFPALGDLARADEQEVLKIWQGLGYYSRARNLHSAAKDIMKNHNGIFPDSYEKLLKLKGIGKYTAAAIASIAFNLPFPVVDGNVLRFFSRYFDIQLPIDSVAGKNQIHQKLLLLIDKKQPGIFNQAIMEFGALQCKPIKPDCANCLFNKKCIAFLERRVDQLPVKSRLKNRKTRYFHYFVNICVNDQGKKFLYLRKREEKDIWENLYDFPMIETTKDILPEKLSSSPEWKKMMGEVTFSHVNQSHLFKHILTHQLIFARFFIILSEGDHFPALPFLLLPLEEVKKYPVPRMIEEFINKHLVSF
jgi:A/G-specific adenine glycosylase